MSKITVFGTTKDWTEFAIRWPVFGTKGGNYVIRSDEELTRFFQEHGGDLAKLPRVDFQTRTVLVVESNPADSTEALTITAVERDADRVVARCRRNKLSTPGSNTACAIAIPRVDAVDAEVTFVME